jgi:hypothetical protein
LEQRLEATLHDEEITTLLSTPEKMKQTEEEEEKSQIIAYKSDLKDQKELEKFLQHFKEHTLTTPQKESTFRTNSDTHLKTIIAKENELNAKEKQNLNNNSLDFISKINKDSTDNNEKNTEKKDDERVSENISKKNTSHSETTTATATVTIKANVTTANAHIIGEENVLHQRYRITLSTIDSKEQKEEIVKQIEKLGGVVLKHFDHTCTHLITSKPTRSEKYLGGTSSHLLIHKRSINIQFCIRKV